MLDSELKELAGNLLDLLRKAELKLATAESCTGGLISALLTAIAGSSDVFERGFVTYSNEAKQEMIGVSAATLEEHGAVSAATASEMASGALEHSLADVAVAVTGIAGPGGGSAEKPVGLVFIAVALKAHPGAFVEEFQFGDIGRDEVRRETAHMALEMLLGYAVDDS